MKNYDELKNAGINIDSLIKRLMGNESLVKVFVGKFTEDNTYEKLTEAFAEKDIKKAEISSHTLKGMCGNLSLDALYALFTEQVYLIRSGNFDKAEKMMTDISHEYEKAVKGIGEWLSRQNMQQ